MSEIEADRVQVEVNSVEALRILLDGLARRDGRATPIRLRVVRNDGETWVGWLAAVEIDQLDGIVDLVAGNPPLADPGRPS